MQSFRSEFEQINHGTKALVEKDISDLAKKIHQFKNGNINEEKFRSVRLARGVYGQRQQGVQMIRIKIPFGKISTKQLLKIADISDEYSNGNLHFTTRQDIQIHHVSLDKAPELWAKLEQDEITLREACGNTVRNITASAEAGIDPNELFDVSHYVKALFEYFLRQPFGQELGRKIKIAFSNNENDSAVTFIHDFGFIPKIINNKKGFKVVIGGGLGAQPFLAQTAFEFLPTNKLIPFVEGAIRVFERHGERVSRHKARLKYLINKIGLNQFLELVENENSAINFKTFEIIETKDNTTPILKFKNNTQPSAVNDKKYLLWLNTNTFEQKQKGHFAAYIKIQLGNILSNKVRSLVKGISKFIDTNDLRITINQGLLIKNIAKEELPFLYDELNKIDLASPGFNSVGYITACPGTDTCNLAISNSTNISIELEKLIEQEFEDLIYDHHLKIKISGCMNSCGQHGLAQIGFHGSSFKVGNITVPAIQILLGGGSVTNGEGRISEKVIKMASKRAPNALRIILNDFKNNTVEGEYFNSYYDKKGKDYFYQLLKPIADNSKLSTDELIDWGKTEQFETAIGIGECAGVVIDLVQTLFYDAEEKLELAIETLDDKKYSDSIYYSYAAFIHSAKALLLFEGKHVNTHHQLIIDFDKTFIESNKLNFNDTFLNSVLQINKNQASKQFAENYFLQAKSFVDKIKNYHQQAILINNTEILN